MEQVLLDLGIEPILAQGHQGQGVDGEERGGGAFASQGPSFTHGGGVHVEDEEGNTATTEAARKIKHMLQIAHS